MNKGVSIKPLQEKSGQKKSGQKKASDARAMRAALLAWYDAQGRALPWRIRPEDRAKGALADPYAVWLSEIMLQQTTVAHATPYWRKFLARFPSVADLAAADRDEVLALWAGLGYYARARNLHKCARVVVDEHAGQFPNTEAELLTLPGIGLYTAATMAAICHDEVTNIVDGNVERVISRIFAVQTPLPKGRKALRDLAATLALIPNAGRNLAAARSGDYGQALMDLGAGLCSRGSPDCGPCPWRDYCRAYAAGNAADYPKKLKKTKTPIRYGAVFVLMSKTLSGGDCVLLHRRAETGLLGGMMGFTGTEWTSEAPASPPKNLLQSAPEGSGHEWRQCQGELRHVFTHFDLRLTVYSAHADKRFRVDGDAAIWAPLSGIKAYALPTVMVKVLSLALDSFSEN